MESGREGLTALDWIGLVVAFLAASFCLAFPVAVLPTFAKMFQDFGGTLPALTRLMFTGWLPALLGLAPLAPLALALDSKRPVGARRALIVGAFVLALAADAVCLGAMYLPIFELAGNVR